jgi:hypothetical protein
MAIDAEPSLPSGLPLAADWAAISVAAASEMRVTTAAVVASAAVPIANNNIAATAADNEDDNNNDVRIHPPPQPTAAVGGNTVEAAGATLRQVAVLSVISNATKISLHAYFEGSDWPLNQALPRGAEFLRGPLGDIMRQYCLEKMLVACQLLNYKKGKFLNTQVSILLNQLDLDKRIREGMVMSASKFVPSTLLRIYDPAPSSYGSNFSNLCAVMNSLPSTARTYIWLLASCPDDACFYLLVGVLENWIQNVAERFPKTAAGVPNAQLDFKSAKELKMRAYDADFMKEYNLTGLPPGDIFSITFGRLGAFLHLALFQAWSDVICDNKKPPIEFPVDCLVGRYAMPVVYYVAG